MASVSQNPEAVGGAGGRPARAHPADGERRDLGPDDQRGRRAGGLGPPRRPVGTGPHRRLPGARGRLGRGGGRGVGCLGSPLLGPSTGRAASVPGARRWSAPGRGHPGRPVVPHPLGDDGPLLGTGRTGGGAAVGAAVVVDEIHGFKYFDERDLLGFVDGTENPTGRAAEVAVTIGDEDPAFAGGSYVIVQKYLHDMAAWDGAGGRGAGAGDRKGEALQRGDGRCGQAFQLARRAEHDRRARRHPAADPAGEHAVRVIGCRASSARTSSGTPRRHR